MCECRLIYRRSHNDMVRRCINPKCSPGGTAGNVIHIPSCPHYNCGHNDTRDVFHSYECKIATTMAHQLNITDQIETNATKFIIQKEKEWVSKIILKKTNLLVFYD